MLVAASQLDVWADALALAPFGWQAVVLHGSFLGTFLGAPTVTLRHRACKWAAASILGIQVARFAKAIRKLEARVAALSGAVSAIYEAAYWNTYMSPVLIYPCLLCKFSPVELRAILAHRKRSMSTRRWAPWRVLPLLSGLFQVTG